MAPTSLVLASAVAGKDVVSETCRRWGSGHFDWTGGGQVHVAKGAYRRRWHLSRACFWP